MTSEAAKLPRNSGTTFINNCTDPIRLRQVWKNGSNWIWSYDGKKWYPGIGDMKNDEEYILVKDITNDVFESSSYLS